MTFGAAARAPALATVRLPRALAGPDATIVAGGGLHEPQDALRLLDAGADLVAIESGLVLSGPGLPKRANDAVRFARTEDAPSVERAPAMSWFWTLLMGLGMLLGSVLALVIAATRVVLPYDEQFVGLSRAELHAINERLLPFMTHDRVTLAGTMVTIGVLYTGLSWFGVRRGQHWAQVAVLSSAAAGFASFCLFLGVGYFDPFHAFVTAVLFQFLLMGVHGRLAEPHGLPPPMLARTARGGSASGGSSAWSRRRSDSRSRGSSSRSSAPRTSSCARTWSSWAPPPARSRPRARGSCRWSRTTGPASAACCSCAGSSS
jgi:hypothetical protein